MKRTLKEVREARGVKKIAVAEAIGVSYPTYQKYEADPRIMRVGDLEKACRFLHCRREDIFLQEDLN